MRLRQRRAPEFMRPGGAEGDSCVDSPHARESCQTRSLKRLSEPLTGFLKRHSSRFAGVMERGYGEANLGLCHFTSGNLPNSASGSSDSSMIVTNRTLQTLMFGAALILAAIHGPAHAGLGSDAQSVQADSARLGVPALRTATQLYDRHDLTTPAGTVHEFVTRSGQVFAVTWSGQRPPDLRLLLANRFDDYRAALAAQSAPGAHRHVAVVLPDLVVQAFGRMRSFQGAAYIPSLVPVGFDLSDLR